MRFSVDGPDIPDELLVARDEGRVVFFCGAGVSRAKAGLPSFRSLARDVLNDLEGTGNSDSKRLIEAAEEVESKARVSGLFSPDRIFGILERDFLYQSIFGAFIHNSLILLVPRRGLELDQIF